MRGYRSARTKVKSTFRMLIFPIARRPLPVADHPFVKQETAAIALVVSERCRLKCYCKRLQRDQRKD
jgi:hypothetical protein